jgi:hypothetical protein
MRKRPLSYAGHIRATMDAFASGMKAVHEDDPIIGKRIRTEEVPCPPSKTDMTTPTYGPAFIGKKEVKDYDVDYIEPATEAGYSYTP